MQKQAVGEINLSYQIQGSGDPLVLIHGLGSRSRDWQYQMEYFSKYFKVLTYDLRGHGHSDKPRGPYSIEQFAMDTNQLLLSLGMTPCHVVGISLGGMIAMQLALDAPENVKSLVLVNTTPDMVVRSIKQRLELWQRLLLVRFFGMRKVGEVLASRIFPGSDQLELRNLFVERWAENDPFAWRESLKGLVGWSVLDRLGEIRCPVLVISADQDYIPVSEKEAYGSKFPDGRLVVIENSHHATPVDQPEKFNRFVYDFLQRKKRGAA